jgi:hypothetical protein
MLPVKFCFSWPSGFRREDLKKKFTTQKEELSTAAMLLTNQNEMSNLNRGPAKWFLPSFGSFG